MASERKTRRIASKSAALGTVVAWLGACATLQPMQRPQRPDVAPAAAQEAAAALQLDASQIKPMYTELLPIDLPTVANVAVMDNYDIRQARQVVEASRGRVESAVGAAFPVIVPTALFEHVEGTVRATPGNLVGVGFNTFQPSIALQWVINPARVIYNIVAAKKRLSASEHEEQAVILETLRRAGVQFYDLALTQTHVAAARQGVVEAEELLRISKLRVATGSGVRADELRAEARLAQRQQESLISLSEFYKASVALAVTLHLDSTVTLVPRIESLPPIHLVRTDLGIDELLEIAVTFRPDLDLVRTLVEAVAADKGATWWGGFGPQFSFSYQYGGITGHSNNTVAAQEVDFRSGDLTDNVRESIAQRLRGTDHRRDESFVFSDQQRADAAVGWRLSLSSFGDLKTAGALKRQAIIDAERVLDRVRAEVVTAAQGSKTNNELIGLAQHQVTSATEALRLTQANLLAGTMTTLDVLAAQDAAAQARLRYARAVVRYNQAQINLLAALGLLSEETLLGDDDG